MCQHIFYQVFVHSGQYSPIFSLKNRVSFRDPHNLQHYADIRVHCKLVLKISISGMFFSEKIPVFMLQGDISMQVSHYKQPDSAIYIPLIEILIILLRLLLMI